MYPIFLYHQKRHYIEIDSEYFYSFDFLRSFFLEYRKCWKWRLIFSGKYHPIFSLKYDWIFYLLKKLYWCRRYQTGSGSLIIFLQPFIATYIFRQYCRDYSCIYCWIYHWWTYTYHQREGTLSRNGVDFFSKISENP